MKKNNENNDYIIIDKNNVKDLFCKVYDASDGHYYDSDECWYCGFRDGVLATLARMLRVGEIRIKNNRVGGHVTQQQLLDLYLEIKEKEA